MKEETILIEIFCTECDEILDIIESNEIQIEMAKKAKRIETPIYHMGKPLHDEHLKKCKKYKDGDSSGWGWKIKK